MGFFKKIGTAVKKGLKQVSLKNAIKIGTPLLGAIPMVGGLAQGIVSNISQAHELKKQAEAELQAGNLERANALQQQAQIIASQQGQNFAQPVVSNFNAFTKGATQEFVDSLPNTAKQNAGIAGSTVIDFSIKEWFKKHWTLLAVVGGVIVGAIFFFRKKPTTNRRR
jgi:hypothetical protein